MSLEAMKMVLATLEDIFGKNKVDVGAINALRQAIEQAEKPCQTGSQCIGGKCPECEQVEKPVAWLNMEDNIFYKYEFKGCAENDKNAVPLYTAPPKREWVGLTDEEMRNLKQKSVDDGMTRVVSDFEYIRAIEAKLKEKNT